MYEIKLDSSNIHKGEIESSEAVLAESVMTPLKCFDWGTALDPLDLRNVQ